MNKKKILIIATCIATLVTAIIIGVIIKISSEGSISRYEWVSMMSDKFNMVEYQNDTPYYVDVLPDNEYFATIQSAREWDVLDDSAYFEGDKKVVGEYAALTAMRAIGAYKVKIYLGLSELPSDDQLIDLAISEGLINKSELSKKISEKQATEMISSAYELYSGKMWVDDYYDYTYSEDVIEIDKEDVISYDAIKEEIIFADKVKSIITSGSIVVFYDNDGFKVSKTVDYIDANGKATLSAASIEDTVDELIMSDLFLSDDVFDAIFEQSPDGISSTKETNGLCSVIPVKSFETSSKGVSISVKITESEAEVTIKSNDLGKEKSKSYSGNFFKKSAIPDMSEEYVEFTTEVTKINIGIQSDYSIFNGNKFNYFLTQIETEMETKFEAGGNVESVIPLATVTLAGNDMIAAVNLELKLVITMDGKVSITADFPSEALFEYRKDSGVRHYANSAANVEAEISCSLEEQLRFEPVIVLLKNKILDLELDIGAGAEASIKIRNNSNVMTCLDISSYAPLLGLGFLNDEDALLGDYIDGKTLEIITADNAPFKDSFHYEWYKNGTSKRVKECTYGNGDYTSNVDTSLKQNHFGILNSEFKKVGDHYEASCKLYAQVNIAKDDLLNLSVGQTYQYYDTNFTVTDMGEYEANTTDHTMQQWWIFDNKYVVNTSGHTELGDYIYYNICILEEKMHDWDPPNGTNQIYVEVSDDFKLYTVDGDMGDLSQYKAGDSVSLHFHDGSYYEDGEGKLDGVFPTYMPTESISIVR